MPRARFAPSGLGQLSRAICPSTPTATILAAMAITVAIEEGLTRGAVWGTHFAAKHGTRTGRRQRTGEVDVLLGLFVDGLPHIRTALRGSLASLGLSLRMGWVYCHQSPIVGWPDTGVVHKCELGDLLIVVRSSFGGRVARRALLVQFKISGGNYGLTDNQGKLYMQWPAFKYTSPKKPWRRSVHPKKPHRGAQVGLFVRCPNCGQPHGQMRANIPGGNGVPFASEIAALLLDGGGRELQDLTAVRRTQGWDRVVWDLICETTRATLKYHGYTTTHRNLGGVALDAMSNSGVAFLVMPDGTPGLMVEAHPSLAESPSLERFDDGPPADMPRQRLGQPPSGAISTVFIDIDEAPD